MTPREIAHKFARKAMMCEFNKHSDRSPEHSKFCDALCEEISTYSQALVVKYADQPKVEVRR